LGVSIKEGRGRRKMRRNTFSLLPLLVCLVSVLTGGAAAREGDQPLANIAIHRARIALQNSAYIKASPYVLGQKVCTISLTLLFFKRIALIKFWVVISVVELVSFLRFQPVGPVGKVCYFSPFVVRMELISCLLEFEKLAFVLIFYEPRV
jgi:hypothetical protein